MSTDAPPPAKPAEPAASGPTAGAAPAPAALAVPARLLLLGAVLLTGATSLAYEVAWTRGLVLVLGSTAATAAIVLAVFVGALGLGARWGGPRADRHTRPLVLYGVLELAAAAWAVLALELAGVLLEPYAAVAAPLGDGLRFVLRVVVAAVVVAPGAFFLGATLPALVRFWVRDPGGAGRGTAWVYGTNTLGAVAGALFTGFWGLEWLGVRGWLWLVAGLAAVVGVAALVAGRRAAEQPASIAPPAGPEGTRLRLAPALAVAVVCGAVGLGLEVVGFRILVFFVEGFTAAFAAMLGVFVLGLGLGSLVLGPTLTRRERPDRVLVVLLSATLAVVVFEGVFVVDWLEPVLRDVKAAAYGSAAGEGGVQAGLRLTALAGSALLFFVPAFLLGPTFALCVRWAEQAGQPTGQAVGRVYLFNSVGTVTAPFLFGFLVVPGVGLHDAWMLVGLLAGAGGFAVAAVWSRRPPAVRVARVGLFVVGTGLLVTAYSVIGGDSSAQVVEASHVLRDRPARKLEAVRTDAVTTASVVQTPDGERILYTDDFAAAATGPHYRYMRMLGHLPVLLAKEPRNAMVIAFGTGTTAGAVAAHDEVERIEVVEVSRAVYDLASYFETANRGVLDDPRTTVVRDDGRNALLLHEPDLDVITLEPLMPYSPPGLPFYTREFYELARDRLRDGGVLCQWLPVHAMPAGLYAAFVRTFFEVFPEGSLWFFEQSTALIATKGEGADSEAFERRAAGVASDLSAAGFTRPGLLLSGYIASGGVVLLRPAPPSPWTDRTVRDLDPFPEFHPTPRASLNTTYLKDTLGYLWSLLSIEDVPPFTEEGSRASIRLREGTARGLLARSAEAYRDWLRVGAGAGDGKRSGELLYTARQEYDAALQALPGEGVLLWRRARMVRRATEREVGVVLAEARAAREAGDEDRATQQLGAVLELAQSTLDLDDGDAVSSERWRAASYTAAVLRLVGRCDAAARTIERALAETPAGSPAHDLLLEMLVAVAAADGGAEAPEASPAVDALLRGAPPCGKEGAELAEEPFRRWREALEGGRKRAIRLAADNLYVVARDQAVESDVARWLRESPAPTEDVAAAVRAALLFRLDPSSGELRDRLSTANPQALREAGRTHTLRLFPDVVDELFGSSDAEVRARAADAVGADGARELLQKVVDLLLDEERAVRLAAIAGLARRDSAAVVGYDPDGPEGEREAATEKIRREFR